MCGIIGAVTKNKSVKTEILQGLKKLEYRGYDSAGFAFIDTNGTTHLHKTTKSISSLLQLSKNIPKSNQGIAHTRWATHGKANTENAHPHSVENEVILVHNGIIENHNELKKELQKNTTFKSETDSEVIAILLHQNLKSGENIEKAIIATCKKLKGSYALAIIHTRYKDRIFCICKESPLCIGKSNDGFFVASDPLAINSLCNEVLYLEKDELFTVTENKATPYSCSYIPKWKKLITHNHTELKKEKHQHTTYLEIQSQPKVIEHLTQKEYIGKALPVKIIEKIKNSSQIIIVACGSSYYCAKVAQYWLEDIAKTQTSVELASEFRYRNPIINPKSTVISLSQSGETLDTIQAVRYIKEKKPNIFTLSIGNNPQSTLARESSFFWETSCGPEIGVATTKVFTAQLICMAILTYKISPDKKEEKSFPEKINQLPFFLKETLKLEKNIIKIVPKLSCSSNILFLGRGPCFPIAQEAALKVQELSYIHAKAYAAGELKHGPLALIDKDITSIILLSDDHYLTKIASNISEISAREGKIIIIGTSKAIKKLPEHNQLDNNLISIPSDIPSNFSPFAHTVIIQLIAYHLAKYKGLNIDKPRNLAKCVTVE